MEGFSVSFYLPCLPGSAEIYEQTLCVTENKLPCQHCFSQSTQLSFTVAGRGDERGRGGCQSAEGRRSYLLLIVVHVLDFTLNVAGIWQTSEIIYLFKLKDQNTSGVQIHKYVFYLKNQNNTLTGI